MPPGKPVPYVPVARRRSSDDLARVIAEEARERREAELLSENAQLKVEREAFERRMLELEGKLDRVAKHSVLPPPSPPRSALAQLQQFWPHAAAIITALAGLVVSFKALTRPAPPDRSEVVYDAVRQEIETKAAEQQQLARDLAELRRYQERLAREKAAEPPRTRSKAAPTAVGTGPDLPPPVPRVHPTPVELPQTLDEAAANE